MKIVLVFNGFSERTGYTSNCLPKSLAKLGHDVHVIAPNVQVYFNHPQYQETYQDFFGDPILPVGEKNLNGFRLHRLPHKTYGSEVYIKGLYKKVRSIKPDVVHIFQVDAIMTHQLLWYKFFLGYKLFTANHVLKSVFPLADNWKKLTVLKKLAWKIKHYYPGRFISHFTKRTYCQTPDAKEIAIDFFGVKRSKCVIDPLGVDTDIFFPFSKDQKNEVRRKFNFQPDDFVCIYTGRFTTGKNPLLLATAIHEINKEGVGIKGLFIGNGVQESEIVSKNGCYVSPFVDFPDLPAIYNIADVAIWPQQDSMSMLDALACGVPIVVSDQVRAKERLDGSGYAYKEPSLNDLKKKILLLFHDHTLRLSMSHCAAEKIRKNYSWDKIAKERSKDYANL